MNTEWHYIIDGEQVGPVSTEDLRTLIADGILFPTDLVWSEGMPDWTEASRVPGLYSKPPPPPVGALDRRAASFELDDDREYRHFVNNKIAAGLCGILLGSIGVHKFVLGLTTPGIIMLLVSLLTCGLGTMITGPIGLIEGIIYLTKTDEEFYELYAIEKREWF